MNITDYTKLDLSMILIEWREYDDLFDAVLVLTNQELKMGGLTL